MRTVTVRRGEKLPENMVNEPLVVRGTAVYPRYELKPGDEIPLNALEDSYTIEVHDDPPQAYLIVPCEPGKGDHAIGENGMVCYWANDRTHKQIPCPLTLEDLRWALGYTGDASPREKRFRDTIAAWAAVSQAKEANNAANL